MRHITFYEIKKCLHLSIWKFPKVIQEYGHSCLQDFFSISTIESFYVVDPQEFIIAVYETTTFPQ